MVRTVPPQTFFIAGGGAVIAVPALEVGIVGRFNNRCDLLSGGFIAELRKFVRLVTLLHHNDDTAQALGQEAPHIAEHSGSHF